MRKKDNPIDKRLSAIAARRTNAPPALTKLASVRKEREKRIQTFRNGVVMTAKNVRIPCVIRDTSSRGARITTEGALALPPVILLIDPMTAARRKARVVWQDGGEAGLQFIA